MRARGDVSNEGGWVTKCVDYQGGGVVKKKTQCQAFVCRQQGIVENI